MFIIIMETLVNKLPSKPVQNIVNHKITIPNKYKKLNNVEDNYSNDSFDSDSEESSSFDSENDSINESDNMIINYSLEGWSLINKDIINKIINENNSLKLKLNKLEKYIDNNNVNNTKNNEYLNINNIKENIDYMIE